MASVTERLQSFGVLEDEEQVDEFEVLVYAVADQAKTADIRILLATLDDDCPFAGVMETVLQQAEGIPGFVNEFVRLLPEVYLRSPRWARTEVRKFLNSSKYVDSFRGAAQNADGEAKEVLTILLTEIAAKSEKLADSALELRDALR